MSQFFSQGMSQQLRMEQKLTPQLIQSMAILQKAVADLEVHINEALETNAALELAEPQPMPSDGKDSSQPPSGADDPTPHTSGDERSFDRLDSLSRDYDLGFDNRAPLLARRIADSGERDAKMGALANTAGRPISLREHLQQQLAFVDVDDEKREACERILDHLDSDGYLRVRLEEVATSKHPPIAVELVRESLLIVQDLEPTGVGARDMIECLLLQLAELPGDNHVERVLIERHLDDLARNRLPAVAKATGFSIGEINEAINVLRQNIVLHPGFLVEQRAEPTIRPDVIVEYADTGGGLTVQLTRGNAPKLRINSEVAAMAKSKDNGKETREFARGQLETAVALIDAVAFRQGRLLEVAKTVVERQADFFDVGVDGLKPLRMSELAEDLGCDPSTISRTVADKYIQTPRGIYPLRYFFTGGTQTEDGKSVGWDRIKAQVRDLVDNEDGASPLNDDQIAEQLKTQGVEISRRTVAKYRGQLEIPTARQRRKF